MSSNVPSANAAMATKSNWPLFSEVYIYILTVERNAHSVKNRNELSHGLGSDRFKDFHTEEQDFHGEEWRLRSSMG